MFFSVFGKSFFNTKFNNLDYVPSFNSDFKVSNQKTIHSTNITLLKNLKHYFKDQKLSKIKIQDFLTDNYFYFSEVIETPYTYSVLNPTKVIFIIKGNHFFNNKDIRKLLKTKLTYTKYDFYNFIKTEITKRYQDQGFLKTHINLKTINKKWKKWIYINVTEGPRIRIAQITVNNGVSKSDIKQAEFIKNNSTHLIKKGFYNKKDLQIGYNNLLAHLKEQGYLQSKMYSDIVFIKNNQAFIKLNIEKGLMTIIKDIKIKNTGNIPKWKIYSLMKSRIQTPLKFSVLYKDLDRIKNMYKNEGYFNMKILNSQIITYHKEKTYASVLIHIQENHRAFISKISIQGLQNIKKSVVMDLLQFKKGDVLTSLKKENSLKALLSTGLWEDVNFSENQKDKYFEIDISFKEYKQRTIKGGLGLSFQSWLTTRAYTEMTYRNLFGLGKTFIIKSQGQASLIQKKIFLEYDILGRSKGIFTFHNSATEDLSLSQSKRIFSYSKNNINFIKKNQINWFINKHINEHVRLRWNVLSFEKRQEACLPFVCKKNPQSISSTKFYFLWDKRDNIFNPLQGYFIFWNAELASPLLGGHKEIAFIKLDFHNHFYWTYKSDYHLGLSFKTGIIQALHNYIPIGKAFILGGSNSLRGYTGRIEGDRIPNKKISPIKQANQALKLQNNNSLERVLKSHYALINLAFKQTFLQNIKVLIFYDAGLVSLYGRQKHILDFGHSVGFGFRYHAFLIPIGLDLAYKLASSHKASYQLHFSIGW